MSEQNNIYQLPNNSHSEDYLQSNLNQVSRTNNPEIGADVALDFHRASEQAVSLEQVKATRLVNEIIEQAELDSTPYGSMEGAPGYMSGQEKVNYLDIKRVSCAIQSARKDMLDGTIVMSREQQVRCSKGKLL